MSDYVEKYGTTVEEAVSFALQDMKLPREEVEVTVLEEPSKGFFGLGSKLAMVRVEPKKLKQEKEAKAAAENAPIDYSEIKKADPEVAAALAAKNAKKEARREKDDRRGGKGRDRNRGERGDREKKAKAPKEARPVINAKDYMPEEKVTAERPTDLVEDNTLPVYAFLKDMLEKMGLDLNVSVKKNADSVYVDIDGKESGSVIGKRGQTLDAIQYLASLIVNKDREDYVKVVVDAENYRAKREKTLEQLACRLADKVARTRKSVRLEPMNPYERKVIHATLQKNPAVVTRSEGEEPYRRVIIELK